MQTTQTIAGTWRIDNDDLVSQAMPDGKGMHQSLPEKFGLGHTHIFNLDRDLSYIETRYSPCNDLAVISRMEQQEPRMVVTLGLQGGSRFTTHQGEGVAFEEGYTSITTFNDCEGARQYQGNKLVGQIRFSLTRGWLDSYFGEHPFTSLFAKPGLRLVSHRPISPQSLIAAHALVNCEFSEPARPLFRRGQAMAILAGELSHLVAGTGQAAIRSNPRDRAIAHRARDILIAEFRNPPSVEALAGRAGTNPFKLKQLFRHFFDNTPYGLLLDIRMNKAHELLKNGRCSVAIAAEAVGYNHASNFSAAFAKYFGAPPRRIFKRDS